ncbi:ABC transporter ATP-binding protein [Candidatus Roizmanbacteria bacterium]|nr:ABC transporter ATP-binding protein [Candidatus Roizmanbacteria bacterium]
MTKHVIEVSHLSKKYYIGVRQPYYELGESLVYFTKHPFALFRKKKESVARIRSDEIWALQDVSFQIRQGEKIGIIGRNGAGKSTLLKILSRITAPTIGNVHIRGRVASLLEVGTGFHPSLTGRENIFLNGAILRMSRKEIQKQYDAIVDFAEVEKFIDTPVKHYSSGMYMRLAFAVAAHLNPEILLVDEVLAVGDITFQKKCLGKMEEVSRTGRTVIFVSHNTQAVGRLCERVLLLKNGKLIEDGKSDKVISTYLQSDYGTLAAREWQARDKAPGNDIVRLISVKVYDEHNIISDTIEITKRVRIELKYEVLKSGWSLVPAIQLFNDKGIVVFTSNDTDKNWNKKEREINTYKSIVIIPGNFLNEGGYFIRIGIGTYVPWRKHFTERDVAGFIIIDSGNHNSARGGYVGQIDGVVRPYLDWKTIKD